MSEYIFQEETIKNLADAFRYKLGDADGLYVDDMRKLVYLMHYDIDNGVTLYDYANNPVYSYSISEAHKLQELPKLSVSPTGYIFVGWSHTLDEINNTEIPLIINAVYSELGTTLKIQTIAENQNCSISIENESGGIITIDWGDTTVETLDIENTMTKVRHTYTTVGEYVVTISSETTGIMIKHSSTALQEVNYGKHVFIIPTDACRNSTNLAHVSIPDSVYAIWPYAFDGCTSLSQIDIPNSVTVIGAYAFNGSGIENMIIPDSVSEIGNYAFANCTQLTSLTLPKTAQVEADKPSSYYFRKTILEGCPNLEQLTLPYVYNPRNTTTSYEHLFGCWFSGTNDGNAYTEVQQGVSGSNTVIVSYVPKTLKNLIVLGGKLFANTYANCTMLEEVTLCDDVTLGDNVGFWFSRCTGLKKVTIGKGITRIDPGAFARCSALETVVLPKTITSIGESAFGYTTCQVIYQGTQEEWNSVSKDRRWNYPGYAVTVVCTG